VVVQLSRELLRGGVLHLVTRLRRHAVYDDDADPPGRRSVYHDIRADQE